MPKGLEAAMTAGEWADLTAYLLSRKGGRLEVAHHSGKEQDHDCFGHRHGRYGMKYPPGNPVAQ